MPTQHSKLNTQNSKLATASTLRHWFLPAGRFLLLLLIGNISAMLLVIILVIVQGGYSDTRQVGTLLVLPADCDTSAASGGATCEREAVLDYALDLYHHGYATRLLLLQGDDKGTAARSYLQAHGFPESALLLTDTGATQWHQVRQASELVRTNGVNSVLLVGTPPQMLLSLKMTHDLGLAAFAAPLPTRSDQTLFAATRQVLREAIAYWRYVLLGE